MPAGDSNFTAVVASTSVRGASASFTGAVAAGSAAITGDITSAGRKLSNTFLLEMIIPAGAAAADFDCVRPVPFAARVVSVTERHQTAGTDAGAVTLMVKKVPSGTAKAAGADVLASGLNMKATADTNQTGTLSGTPANLQLAAGDGLGLVLTGTGTSLDGVAVIVELERL